MNKVFVIFTALMALMLTQCSSEPENLVLPQQQILTEAQLQNGEDLYAVGQNFERRNELSSAFSWYLKAAQTGLPKAQYKVAQAYESGRQGVAKNRALAKKWYKSLVNNPEYEQLAQQALERL